jgi:hypothetical protein
MARRIRGAIGGAVAGAFAAVVGLPNDALGGTWSQITSTPTPIFNDASNWGGVSPVGAVNIFDSSTNYNGTIDFNASISVTQLSFRNTTGAINFNLQGNTLTTTGTPALQFTTASTLNDITFTGGAINVGTATSPFAVGTSGSSGHKLTFTGAGTTFTGTSTGSGATVGPAGSNNNTLTISNGALLSMGNTTTVGSTTSTGNLADVNNATLLYPGGARGIIVHNGNTFRVTEGTAGIPTSTFNAGSTFDFRSGIVGMRNVTFQTGGPLTVGDGLGNPASLALTFGGSPTLTATAGVLLKSDGRLVGNNAGTNGVVGNLSGERDAGNNITAKVAPSVVAGATMVQTSRFGTIQLGTPANNRNWDNSNIEIELELGDFPATLGAVVPPDTFSPPADRILVTGQFTLGGIFEVDLTNYVAPQDMDYEIKLVGWTSTAGNVGDVTVNFVGGPQLEHEFRADGFYVMAAVPEPTAAAGLGLALVGVLARRRPRLG